MDWASYLDIRGIENIFTVSGEYYIPPLIYCYYNANAYSNRKKISKINWLFTISHGLLSSLANKNIDTFNFNKIFC